MQEIKYIADIYLRLSKEDGDKEESDSIGNQRALILEFLKSMPDISVHKIKIDDGYSGVDFLRPAFTEMIEDINEGIVNCVVVKDFSRFGRNYIESGRYIQVLFPQTGVRFIAVNDGYDSAKTKGFANNIIVPFKNIMDDAYCADISTKVRSHLEIKRKKGQFVGAFAVYGYVKDENNKNKLIIDPFAADVVRDVFRLKLEGISAQGIADKLNQNGILSPMEYKRFNGERFNTTFKVNTTAKWQSVSVKRILTNAVYTGVLEQGKRTKTSYKVRKCAEVPKEQWIRSENTHEPIIEADFFETIQNLLKQDTRAVKSGTNVSPLSGIIICGDCGGAMVRKTYKKGENSNSFYVCANHRRDTSRCSTHTISVTECEKAVLDAMRLHIPAVLDIERAMNCAENMGYYQDSVRKLTARLEAKQDEIKRDSDFRLSLHESYREGVISQKDFKTFTASYNTKISDAETASLKLKEEIERMAAGESENHDWINKFRACVKLETLERRTVAELVERVRIFENNRIELIFRHNDEFTRLYYLVKEAV